MLFIQILLVTQHPPGPKRCENKTLEIKNETFEAFFEAQLLLFFGKHVTWYF